MTKLMDDLLNSVSFVGWQRDWRSVPETGVAEDEPDAPEEKEYKQVALARAPGIYERKVDFVQAKNALTQAESKAVKVLSEELTLVRDRFFKHLAKFDGTLKFINGIQEMRGTPNVRKLFLESLLDIMREGSRAVRDELNAARKLAVAVAFNPQAATDYLRTKADFFITGLNKDLTQKAKQILVTSLDTGESNTKTMERLRILFQPYVGTKKITDDKVITPFRLETIVRTNLTDAYNRGRVLEGRAAGDLVTGYEFSAILDERTTEVCQHLDGKVFLPDDPELDTLRPPLHFNAVPAGTLVRIKGGRWQLPIEKIKVGMEVLTHKFRYRQVTETMFHPSWPEEIVVTLATGKQLTVTDDHPVLTQRGWICGGDLTQEDVLFSIESPCLVCGKSSRGTFCSRACQGRYTRNPENEKACLVCRKSMLGLSYGKEMQNRQCCSKACAKIAQRKLPIKDCLWCGVQMKSVWKSPKSKDRKYCSFRCYFAHMGSGAETSLEMKVREILESRFVSFDQKKRFGRYEVDFFLPHRKLIIEVDGAYWHAHDDPEKQKVREHFLLSKGLSILRLSEGVVKTGRAVSMIEAVL